MTIRVPRCYDSHLHLIPTGEMNILADLSRLDSVTALSRFSIPTGAWRGEWILGFGWDATAWNEKPTRENLDLFFKDAPVAFSRKDGHALWVNTKALQASGLWQQRSAFPPHLIDYVDFDSSDWPAGMVYDRALEAVMASVPAPTEEHLIAATAEGIRILRQAGFTHLREMMADRATWKAFRKMDADEMLGAYIEVNLHCPDFARLPELISLYHESRREETPHLRAAGVKIFIDGAMGSDGALLSHPYEGSGKKGFQMWTDEDFCQALRHCWSQGVPVAVHCIGDGAAHIALSSAQALRRQGMTGILHLEHLQMLAPVDEKLFKDLSVSCHFQPSHFLSDRAWLKDKLGERAAWTFPWGRLEKLGVPFYFGSDTPVESASLVKTKLGLEQSREAGLSPLTQDWTYPHSHPDRSWGERCWTELAPNAEVVSVHFDGKRVL